MSIVPALLPAAQPSLPRRLEGRLAVLIASALARRPPRQIRAVLVRLASGQRPANRLETERAWDVVVGVSRRCAGRRGCLVRSLATALICRWRGSWPTWCVGVRATGGAGAHAWVEADGEPVREPPGTALAYRTIISVRVPPRGDA